MIANEFITNTLTTGKANDGKFETSWLVEARKSADKSLIDSIFDASCDFDDDSAAMDYLRPAVAAAVSKFGFNEVAGNLVAVAQTAEAMTKAAASLMNSATLAARIAHEVKNETAAVKAASTIAEELMNNELSA